MEYKNYEEWDADAQKIQADLEDAGDKLKQALIDGDDEAAAQWEDKYDKLLNQSRDHMAKMPLRSETPPDKKGPLGKRGPGRYSK